MFAIHQKTPQSYEQDRLPFSAERMFSVFEAVFGVPRNCLPREFKKALTEVVNKYHPDLRCSTSRAILEGRIPGIPSPVPTIHPQWGHRVRQVLALMDCLDTMVYDHLESQKPDPDVMSVLGKARTEHLEIPRTRKGAKK